MIDDNEVYDYNSAVWLAVVTVDQTEEMTAGIPVPAGTKIALEMTIDRLWEATVPKGVASPIAPFDFFIDEAHFEIIDEYPDYDTNCRICGGGARLAGGFGDVFYHRCSETCKQLLPSQVGYYPSYDPNRPVKTLEDFEKELDEDDES